MDIIYRVNSFEYLDYTNGRKPYKVQRLTYADIRREYKYLFQDYDFTEIEMISIGNSLLVYGPDNETCYILSASAATGGDFS